MKLFEYYDITFWGIYLISIFPFILLCVTLGIQKLLYGLYSKLWKNKSFKALLETDIDKTIITSSNDNLTTKTKNPTVNLSVFYKVVLYLPIICFIFSILFVINSISIRLNDEISQPSILSNKSDSETLQSFVKLWKERNESQMDLIKWIEVIANNHTQLTENKHFIEKFEKVNKKIEASNTVITSQLRQNKGFFFAGNNKSISNPANTYYSVKWIFFNALMTICCYFSITFLEFLRIQNHSLKKEQFYVIGYQIIVCMLLFCYNQISFPVFHLSFVLEEMGKKDLALQP